MREREGFQRLSEVFRGFQRFSDVFRGPLRDPLRGRFSSQRLSVLLPLTVLPLNLSPRDLCTPDGFHALGNVGQTFLIVGAVVEILQNFDLLLTFF